MKIGVCYLCGKKGMLEEHHVFGGPNRTKSEIHGLKATLCGESCHRTGLRAAHNCRETMVALRAHFQIIHMIRHKLSVREFINEFGRNYIDCYEDERSYPMNLCVHSGRLTRDPELRRTGEGKAVTSFSLAVARPGTKDKTDFLDFVAWEKTAEFIAKYFKKGSVVEVTSYATKREFTDKGGNKRWVTEFKVQQAFFALTSKAGEGKKEDNSWQSNAGSEPDYSNSDFAMLDDDDAQLPF